MDLGALLCSLRQMLDDETQPYLWSDPTLTRFLNNAVREACIRARLLKDDAVSLPALCVLPVTAGESRLTYDKHILVVRSGILRHVSPSGSPPPCPPRHLEHHKLRALTADSMDRQEPYWDSREDLSNSAPRYMVMDLAQKTIRLWPTPQINAELHLRVWRMPLEADRMKAPSDCPLIELPDPEELRHWAAHEAYLIKDAETFDPTRSASELSLFEQRFGTRPTLHDMARWADSPPRVRHAHMF